MVVIPTVISTGAKDQQQWNMHMRIVFLAGSSLVPQFFSTSLLHFKLVVGLGSGSRIGLVLLGH